MICQDQTRPKNIIFLTDHNLTDAIYQQVVVFGLRSGHCRLRFHLHRLGLTHTPNCPCDTGPHNPEHVLQPCRLHWDLSCGRIGLLLLRSFGVQNNSNWPPTLSPAPAWRSEAEDHVARRRKRRRKGLLMGLTGLLQYYCLFLVFRYEWVCVCVCVLGAMSVSVSVCVCVCQCVFVCSFYLQIIVAWVQSSPELIFIFSFACADHPKRGEDPMSLSKCSEQ